MIAGVVRLDAGGCRFRRAGTPVPIQADPQPIPPAAMLRIHGDRFSLLAALTAHWADQQLRIPQTLRPIVRPIPRGLKPKR